MEVPDPRPPIEVSRAMKRQFYPTVVLLISLLHLFKFRPQRRVDHLLDTPLHGTDLLRIFKDKLAFLCCTEYGSKAVSACTVLWRVDDTLEYVFAYNQVSCLELGLPQLKQGIEDMLLLFHQESPFATRKDAILSHVLAFNAIRVKAYLKSYHGHLEACLEACTPDENGKGELLSKLLESLLGKTERALGSSTTRNEVDVRATQELIASVYETYHSDAFRLVQARVTREERYSGGDQYLPWAELVHVSGRLISYKRAVEVCHMAFTTWPSLLESYEIVIVPSSTPTEKVLKARALSAEGCIGKTTDQDTSLRQVFNAQYDRLRVHLRLDDKVAEIWKSNPKPIVHSEMQLLHMLEHTEGGTSRRRFFEGDMFIGTSKPPCRLCSYYFHECGTQVEIRSSHRNVYLPWRAPDVFDQQGAQTRDEIYRKIKQRLEKDLHEILRTSTGDGRLHDSTNYSEAVADPRWSVVGDIARSYTTTPIMSEVSRPVSSPGIAGEDFFCFARHGAGSGNAARKGASSSVGSMEAACQAQMATAQRSAASQDGMLHPVTRPGEAGQSMFAMDSFASPVGFHSSCQRATPVVEEEDEDGGGVLLFSGRSKTSPLKGQA